AASEPAGAAAAADAKAVSGGASARAPPRGRQVPGSRSGAAEHSCWGRSHRAQHAVSRSRRACPLRGSNASTRGRVEDDGRKAAAPAASSCSSSSSSRTRRAGALAADVADVDPGFAAFWTLSGTGVMPADHRRPHWGNRLARLDRHRRLFSRGGPRLDRRRRRDYHRL
ncbi:unnamed protein product, partial [Ectocarpus sp. 12 AP-2014]